MTKAKAQQGDSNRSADRSGSLSRGDAAILRFLGGAEILEAICGYNTGNSEEPRTTNSRLPLGEPALHESPSDS